ncbi:MAG: serine/threonine-protein kinase [Thermoanaerobaculia bacterium]|nr:serine/threonine-protein kinase [Thermoanaerobaculia bacterium]
MRTGSTAGSQVLAQGTALGRYFVLHKLGEGGMGQVYAAYDPELDRRLAIKVLHFGADDPTLASRLRQEGRALARLRHPNVVTVFDVGIAEHGLFIATELVDGMTVDSWLRASQRTWREVLDVFVDVGEGVAAAHAQGLVHRDLKPGNMMVTGDGRGVVLDFGIARDAETSEGSVVDPAALVRGGPLGAESTMSGRAAGTPAFMAPEQKAGQRVGPAADVYSYCLSLFYALYGQLPKEDDPTGDPADGHVASALPGKAVPARLRRWVRSGLRTDPERRPRSMKALVRDLRRLRDRRRNVARQVGTFVLAFVALTGLWLWRQGDRACASAGDPIQEVWNASRSQGLEQTLLATERPFAAGVWKTVRGALDAYSADWRESAESWCKSARDGSQSAELFDLRTECLSQRARDMEATLAVLTEDPGRRLLRAVDMVNQLPPVSDCLDIRALRAPVQPPAGPEMARQLDALREGQARVRALWAAGEFEPARDLVADLLPDARSLGHWPLTAELLYQRGLVENAGLEPEAAETLKEAVVAAGAGHHVRLTAEILIRLVRVATLQSQDFEAANSYAEQAASALGALGRPADLAARLEEQLALRARQQGHYDDALRHLLAALDWKVEALGPRHPGVSDTLLRLGKVYAALKQPARAKDHLARALEIQLQTLGEAHPAVAETHVEMGTLARVELDLASALEHHGRASAIYLRVHGSESPKNAQSLTYLAELQVLDGQSEQAQASFDEALRVLREVHGPRSESVAVVLATMASAWTEAGDDAAALQPYGEALDIYRSIYGADHWGVGSLHFNLATVQLRLGRYEDAAGGFDTAGEIYRSSLGPDHPLVTNALTGQGDALVRQGLSSRALPLLRRAMQRDRDAVEARGPKERADTAFALARALDPEDEEARQLAEMARELYSSVSASSERELGEVEQWLAETRSHHVASSPSR